MILLTSTSCAPCKVVKQYIIDNKLEGSIAIVDISSEQGMKLVQDKGVRSVPALVTPTGNLTGQMPIMKALQEYYKEG